MTAPNQTSPSTLFAFVFCLALAGSFAGQAATNNLAAEPDVLRATLTNGLRIIIVRNTLAPVVTTMINYRVGSDECSGEFPGTAHAMEHMMFRGSPGLSADQLAGITAALGGDFEAYTKHAVTQYFFTIPAEYLDVALHIEATRMRDLLANEKLWGKERGAIEQEVAEDLSNPEYVFYIQLMAAAEFRRSANGIFERLANSAGRRLGISPLRDCRSRMTGGRARNPKAARTPAAASKRMRIAAAP